MGFGVISGKRVSLRAIRGNDLAAIGVWYDDAVAAAGIPGPIPLLRGAAEGRSVREESDRVLVIERAGEAEAIGIMQYQVRERWLAVSFIALAKACRGWGYGSEAVRLLEKWATRERVDERFRAEVPVGNGLGLYFWLRLGYRPAGRDVSRWRRNERADSMAMVRLLNDKPR